MNGEFALTARTDAADVPFAAEDVDTADPWVRVAGTALDGGEALETEIDVGAGEEVGGELVGSCSSAGVGAG